MHLRLIEVDGVASRRNNKEPRDIAYPYRARDPLLSQPKTCWCTGKGTRHYEHLWTLRTRQSRRQPFADNEQRNHSANDVTIDTRRIWQPKKREKIIKKNQQALTIPSPEAPVWLGFIVITRNGNGQTYASKVLLNYAKLLNFNNETNREAGNHSMKL